MTEELLPESGSVGQVGEGRDAVRAPVSETAPAPSEGTAPAPQEDGAKDVQDGRDAQDVRPGRSRRGRPASFGATSDDAVGADASPGASTARDVPSGDVPQGEPSSKGSSDKDASGTESAEKAGSDAARQGGHDGSREDAPREGSDQDGGHDARRGEGRDGKQVDGHQADGRQADDHQADGRQADGRQGGQQPRRTHQSRRSDGGNRQQQRSHEGSNPQGGQNGGQNNGHGNGQNGSHGNGQGNAQGGGQGGNQSAARSNRQQGSRNGRNNRNNRNSVPTEPSLSREELQAMKVAELREKARELDIETTGKRKAELVDEVYTTAAHREGFRDIEGVLDITSEGYGHILAQGYMESKNDAFVSANFIRAAGLRRGDLVSGALRPSRQGDKYPALTKIYTVNGLDPEEIKGRPKFADLTPIYPNEPLKMEHGKDSITGRAIDIVAPVGKGQRGLIVSPPKAGKTTVLKHICQSIAINNPEVHVICLLVDERPEEVTDMQRSIQGEVVASTFDMPAENHTRVAELVIERAKRIVELGGDVVVVLDSITRLARAYNLAAPASGRILSGGVDSAALYPPKRFLGAARNIENGGSLTILASALVDTGSKMDEVIFEEFKGTGNMELKLDRDLADRRIFPAIDPVASGTRNEELLLDENMKPFIWGIRRVLANMNSTERAAASFIKGLKSTNSNQEFLIRSAKKAQDYPDAV